jgi:polyisoprenyl-teichoic acid--peptidoglycan teichoic acid transferase
MNPSLDYRILSAIDAYLYPAYTDTICPIVLQIELKTMLDEQENKHLSSAKNDENKKVSRQVYSTREYTDKRQSPPAPPPMRSSSVRERNRRRRMGRGTNTASEWIWVILAGALFAVVLVVSFAAFILVQSSEAQVAAIPTADVVLPTPVVAYNDYSNVLIDDTLVMPDGRSIELIPWDGQSRFTMIMVGLDRRPGQTGLTYRTDTMMLVSIDPASNSIGVLSLPRDLYVVIPGYASRQRINSAMVFGESSRLGYGPTLMMATVQNNFGIRVNDFLAVDFQAFIDVVDIVGGINITIDYTINDPRYPDMNYGYDPFYLAAGSHLLMGYDALRFARTRHGDSDIRRAERQQMAIFAIRDRILNFDMVPTLIAQSPALWSSWQDNIYTGLSFEQIIQLSLFVKDVPRENITMGVVDFRYLQSWSTPQGASVLIPNNARLPQLMTEVFGANYNQ